MIPGNVEQILNYSINVGNIAMNGIFLDIYIKRNLFYLSLLNYLHIYLITYIFNIYVNIYIKLFFIIIIIFKLFLYVKSCFTWRNLYKNGKLSI